MYNVNDSTRFLMVLLRFRVSSSFHPGACNRVNAVPIVQITDHLSCAVLREMFERSSRMRNVVSLR